MTQKSARQIVEKCYAAFLERGDLDEFMEGFADDAELIEVESLPMAGAFAVRRRSKVPCCISHRAGAISAM
jgi:ketosteroid isomerase-like protein